MKPPAKTTPKRKAFTLAEVMVAASIFTLTMAVILSTVLTATKFIRHQEITFDVGDAANRVIGTLNRDSSSVGIVQVFTVSGTPKLPPYDAGSWDGSGSIGNVLALAYPANRLDQASPIGRLILYHVNPADNTLIRDALDFTALPGGGVAPGSVADLMALYNLRFTEPLVRVNSVPLARVYPWALVDSTPGNSGKKAGLTTFSAAPGAPQPLFSTEGPSANARPLAIMCTIASIRGDDTAKSTLLHTLNLHD